MSMTQLTTFEIIKQQIERYPLILYMKGTPEKPCCGFSARVVDILKACRVKFAHVNILEQSDIRRDLPQYSNWPTFPQLYYKGELLGGCDIVEQLYITGQLEKIIGKLDFN
ncbi:Grx4 family monothiol glutaredoxin [Rickettsiella grylli]|uniref:Glutaredoxin n=1 Tax=Rickettsiella grylli TaxID=59196 RepID=A8PPX1_9COXI|nr:Grx4 family monothiol glutaredoxin [Rickettsiella grylli]EDP46691.1 putative glutaredoxin homolog [Rickettsiella grylli]